MGAVSKTLKIVGISWIALTLPASGVPGLVLCIGADGHISLEPAHEGGCWDDETETVCDTAESSAARETGTGRNTGKVLAIDQDIDCCGDCLDVSFSSDTVARLAYKRLDWVKAPLRLLVVGLRAQGVALNTRLHDSRALQAARRRVPAHLIGQRSIILRV